MGNKTLAWVVLTVLFLGIGCAQVQVKAPKEPIKVDITMRLDVYQHVTNDIDNIESMVSGKTEKPNNGMKLNFLIAEAYAEDKLPPEAEDAVAKRKGRYAELTSLESKGAIGENKLGLVEVKAKGEGPAYGLVVAENKDRMIIYEALAKKNGITLEAVQKIYASRLQADAPAGTPIEAKNPYGNYEWKNK